MNGSVERWSKDEYDKDKRARSTGLKILVDPGQGPAKYFREVVKGQRFDEDDDERKTSLVLGSLLHEWLLEGKRKWFVTKERRGSRAYEDDCDDHPGMVALKGHEEKKLNDWREAVMANAPCRKLFETHGFTEQTIIWDHEVNGVIIPSKCRLDFLGSDQGVIDLKTTRMKSRADFEKQMVNLHYDLSAAWYLIGMAEAELLVGRRIRSASFSHLVVMGGGNEPAWAYLWPLGPDWIECGISKVKAATRVLADCMSSGVWPDWMQEAQGEMTAPPVWAIEQSRLLEHSLHARS